MGAVEDDDVTGLQNEERGISVIVLLELGLDRDFRKNWHRRVIKTSDHNVAQTVDPTHKSSLILRTWNVTVKLGYIDNSYNDNGYNNNGYNDNGYNDNGYNDNGYNDNGYNEQNKAHFLIPNDRFTI